MKLREMEDGTFVAKGDKASASAWERASDF